MKKSKNEIQSIASLPSSIIVVLLPLPELIPDLVPVPAIISVSDGNDKETEISSSAVSFIPISIFRNRKEFLIKEEEWDEEKKNKWLEEKQKL